MNTLKAGFARVNINPKLGTVINGYFKPRHVKGILDDLELNALALECNGKKALIITVDTCGIKQEMALKFRTAAAEAAGIDVEAVYLHVTHTHTGAFLVEEGAHTQIEDEYINFVLGRIADVAVYAFADLKDAKMGYGTGHAPNVAFVRRYVMKDGSIKTNPGVNNPDIVGPVGGVTDDTVSVVRFTRENAEDIVLASFANHPDVVGGELISADWPGLTRRTVEKILDGTKCLVLNGTQGDINHVNVFPTGGFLNDMFMDFDDVSRGYAHAKYIARVVTGGVLQAFDKVAYVDVDSLNYLNKRLELPSNKPTPEQLPEAIRINDLHNAGKDAELPYEGMMLTTIVAEAGRMVRLADAPDTFDMTLSGIALGPVAFVGIPGEPFSGIGKLIRESDAFDLIITNCLTNGGEGYFPMQDSYDEGGYEARSSNFKAGVAEHIAAESKKILEDLKK